MKGFVCLCQAERKLRTQDGSSAGPGFIDWRLPPFTSGYTTWVLVLMLHCVMGLALTGCWMSPLSLISWYDLMISERFQGPVCDGACYCADPKKHPVGVIKKVIMSLSGEDAFSFWRMCFFFPSLLEGPQSHPFVLIKKSRSVAFLGTERK